MRSLYLIRHGEAEPENRTDFQRQLTPHGIAEAVWLGNYLETHPLPAAAIICSPAERAQMTATLISQQLCLPSPTVEDNIYEAEIPALLEIIQHIPSYYQTLLLIGHNPGISALAEYLSNSNDSIILPTCGACCLEFSINDWQEIDEGMGEIALLTYPENPYSS